MDPAVTDIPMGVGEQPQGRMVKGGIGHCYIYEINDKHKVCTTT